MRGLNKYMLLSLGLYITITYKLAKKRDYWLHIKIYKDLITPIKHCYKDGNKLKISQNPLLQGTNRR